MGYLKTVVTYHQPSEAEIDKAFLESHEIAVCLLNANTSRNELGAPFYIQLQVADSEYTKAVDLLRAHNPQRFGSAERVAEIERMMFRSILRFFAVAIPIGTILFFIIPGPTESRDPYDFYPRMAFDWRVPGAFFGGVGCGVWFARKKKDTNAKPA